MQNLSVQNIKNTITNPTKMLSLLKNPSATLPVAVIEIVATAGRTYQGYKRGGKTEARERICEETTSALFWLFGVKMLNKLGDIIGKNVFKLKGLDYDVGKDALRAPFHNLQCDKKNLTAVYKFSKILGSALIATSFVGFCLPKINHAITNKVREKQGLPPLPEQNHSKKNKNRIYENNLSRTNKESHKQADSSFDSIEHMSLNSYVKNSRYNVENNLSFKGSNLLINGMLAASHNLENNTAWRLMSTDVGIVAGRVYNSRNKVEAAEFLFRDTMSVYFYIFAASHVAALLNKATGNSPIHPNALNVTKDFLKDYLKNSSVNLDDFSKALKGKKIDDTLKLVESGFDKNNVMTLDIFNKLTEGKFSAKAELMAKLQPMMNNKAILSKMQIQDIFSDKLTSDPVFLRKILNDATYGAAGDEKRFVSRKITEGIRNSVDGFSNALVKYAKSRNISEIDSQLIEKFAKRTNRLNLFYQLAGMAVAGFGLAYIIPKLQYKMSEKKTGSKEFPAEMNLV